MTEVEAIQALTEVVNQAGVFIVGALAFIGGVLIVGNARR